METTSSVSEWISIWVVESDADGLMEESASRIKADLEEARSLRLYGFVSEKIDMWIQPEAVRERRKGRPGWKRSATRGRWRRVG